MTTKKSKFKIRYAIQIFFFILVGAIATNHALSETGQSLTFLSTASLHAICPFGGVVTLYNLATLGTFVQKIHDSSVILMVIVFGSAILFGPVFCGWICPLGSIQEWLGKIGRKIFKKRYNHFIPKKVDGYLRYLRYVVLIMIVYMTAKSGYLMFVDADPFHALFLFWTGDAAIKSIIILLITLGASLFVERPWCKYACPYGALLGVFNFFNIFKIRRDATTCTNCKKCDNVCPMNIEVSTVASVNNHQCIGCLECTSEHACPVPKTVDLMTKMGGK